MVRSSRREDPRRPGTGVPVRDLDHRVRRWRCAERTEAQPNYAGNRVDNVGFVRVGHWVNTDFTSMTGDRLMIKGMLATVVLILGAAVTLAPVRLGARGLHRSDGSVRRDGLLRDPVRSAGLRREEREGLDPESVWHAGPAVPWFPRPDLGLHPDTRRWVGEPADPVVTGCVPVEDYAGGMGIRPAQHRQCRVGIDDKWSRHHGRGHFLLRRGHFEASSGQRYATERSTNSGAWSSSSAMSRAVVLFSVSTAPGPGSTSMFTDAGLSRHPVSRGPQCSILPHA